MLPLIQQCTHVCRPQFSMNGTNLDYSVPYKAAKRKALLLKQHLAGYLPKINYFILQASHCLFFITDAFADWGDTPDHGLTTTLIFGPGIDSQQPLRLIRKEIDQKLTTKFQKLGLHMFSFHTSATLKLKDFLNIHYRNTSYVWK